MLIYQRVTITETQPFFFFPLPLGKNMFGPKNMVPSLSSFLVGRPVLRQNFPGVFAGHQPDLGAAVASRRCTWAGRADARESVPWRFVSQAVSRYFG